VLVQVLRADGQLSFLDPLLCVDTEVDLSGVRSAPVSSGQVRLYLGQPDLRVLLGLEGLVRANALVVGPEVRRGPAAGTTVRDAMKSLTALSGIRTCRPTFTYRMRRSSISRRGKRAVVPSSSATWSTDR
jgi:hypothetical protein